MKSKTISYRELADKLHGIVLCNNATQVDEFWHESIIVGPLLEKKLDEDREEYGEEYGIYDYLESIYQTFIIDDTAARDLVNHTTELVSYSDTLDVFLWHVTHYGTSWNGVHTQWYDRADDIDKDHTQYAGSTEELLKWRNG